MARRRAVAVATPSQFSAAFFLKLLRSLLILALVLFVVVAGAGGVLTYVIVTAHNDTENVSPSSYLLSNYENVNFKDHAGGEHEGWLLLGLRGAPVIFLCHGYNSNRSELLTLGTALRDNHFNVYLFNFHQARGKRPNNNLGMQQAEDLLAAIQNITKRPYVNPRRVGVYGVSTGAYAGLVATLRSSLVKALVTDSLYENPDQMFDAQVDRLLGGSSPYFRLLTEQEFHLLAPRRKIAGFRDDLPKLNQVPKLFISGRDFPLLASTTEELYELAPQPKKLLVLERAQPNLVTDSEKKEYENQVLSFFLQNLPLRAD